MDKIAKYRQIIERLLSKRLQSRLANSPEAVPHLVKDPDKDEYLLVWVGWSGKSYRHGLMFHLQIIDNKIWIHEDKTDYDIANRLVEEGIPKSDIVLGYVAPYLRDSAGFATA
jgi:XisI protein